MIDIFSDIAWVKVIYPDKSTYIFRGTCSTEVCSSIGVDSPDSNSILDISKKKFVNISDCEISFYRQFPSYDREVDNFASRFI